MRKVALLLSGALLSPEPRWASDTLSISLAADASNPPSPQWAIGSSSIASSPMWPGDPPMALLPGSAWCRWILARSNRSTCGGLERAQSRSRSDPATGATCQRRVAHAAHPVRLVSRGDQRRGSRGRPCNDRPVRGFPCAAQARRGIRANFAGRAGRTGLHPWRHGRAPLPKREAS